MSDAALLVICEVAHKAWCSAMRGSGFQYGETTDLVKKTHSDLVPFSKLKEDSLAAEKKVILTMLREAWHQGSGALYEDIESYDLDSICDVVHNQWIRRKLSQGLALGHKINEAKGYHCDIRSFSEIREDRKAIERLVLKAVLQQAYLLRDDVAELVHGVRRCAPILPQPQFLSLRRTNPISSTRMDCIRLEFNEYPDTLPAAFWQKFSQQLSPTHLAAYPELYQAYEALSAYTGLPVNCLAIAEGSDGIIRQVCHVFLGAGKSILLPTPTYGMYPVYAKMFGADILEVPYSEDFTFSADDLISCLNSSRPALLAIAQPSGVFGSVVSDTDLERIIVTAQETGTVVFLDGVHTDYYPDIWQGRLAEFDHLILARSFSKAGGLAGVRFGYSMSSPWLAELITRARPVDEISSMAVLAGKLLLENPQWLHEMVQHVHAGRSWLAEKLENAGWPVYRGHGNFFLVKTGPQTDLVYSALYEKNIRVRSHQGHPILAQWLRITAGPVSLMEKVWNVFKEIANESPR